MIFALHLAAVIAIFALVFVKYGESISVSFDGRSFLIDGERKLFIAGSIHYPRASRKEWPQIIKQAKDHGINLIQTYVFWDIHEPENNQWNFPSDPNSSDDLVAFIQEAAKQGLYVHLRIAGYICAEWNFGGLPAWLRDLNNTTLRTYDETWLTELSQFVEKTLSVVKAANLLASQGGPIVMLQIENEYGNMEAYYGKQGIAYVNWLTNYALSLDVGNVPWIMCQQGEGVGTAPTSPKVINACNGFYCDNWISSHAAAFPDSPHMWTENWPGWFQNWGQPIPHRPAVDVSFAVTRWFAKGGSYMNYYMVFGGTTFGRKVGGPLIVTSYDYDVAINEYTQRNEPKYSHLTALHSLLYEHQAALLGQMPPATLTPLPGQVYCEIHTYTTTDGSDNISFYSNWNDAGQVCVFSASVSVPSWSVSIVVGDGQVVYNTKTSVATTISSSKSNEKVYKVVKDFSFSSSYQAFIEPLPTTSSSSSSACVLAKYPLEQLSITKDTSDFLWYSTNLPLSSSTNGQQQQIVLSFASGTAGGGVFYLYIDGILVTNTYGDAGGDPIVLKTGNSARKVVPLYDSKQLSFNITLPPSTSITSAISRRLDILSESMGLQNYGPFLEKIQVGIVSNVSMLDVTSGKTTILTEFTHTIGLQGEAMVTQDDKQKTKMNKQQKLAALTATSSGSACASGSLCWYTSTFKTPSSLAASSTSAVIPSLALNLAEVMGKGQCWINGHSLGRYWNITAVATIAQNKCQDICATSEDVSEYQGAYNGDRCRTDCGDYSQQYYKLPYDWLQPVGSKEENIITLFEEVGGMPEKIQLYTVTMSS